MVDFFVNADGVQVDVKDKFGKSSEDEVSSNFSFAYNSYNSKLLIELNHPRLRGYNVLLVMLLSCFSFCSLKINRDVIEVLILCLSFHLRILLLEGPQFVSQSSFGRRFLSV